MRVLNPDTLEDASPEELLERQSRTGEVGSGKTVWCCPDPSQPKVWQQQSRVVCLLRPYPSCPVCPHRSFELIFEEEPLDDWVMCPRWKKSEPVREPDFYTPVHVSECRDKPYPFCLECPSREELVQLSTDKKKQGWLSRYRRFERGG